MRILAETKEMTRENWLEIRKRGIGGSDAATLAGANQYKSPLVLYMEKLNLFEGKPVGEAALWGNLLEDIVAQEFIKRYTAEVEDAYDQAEIEMPRAPRIQRRNAILQHDEHDFMLANVDRYLFCPIKGKGLLECKTASAYVAEEWKGDDVPDQYFIQVQHYLAITDLAYAYIAVLIGGNTFRYYYIERDQAFITDLIEIEKKFWNENVLQQNPPRIDGSNATTEMYKIMYPQSYDHDQYITNLPSVYVQYVEELDAVKQLIEVMSEEKSRLENEIKAVMATTEVAFAGPHKITWKTASNGVRALKIKVDSVDKDKFYEARRKEYDKDRKEIEKQSKELAKIKLAREKEAEKERKAAEKVALAALKSAKANLKKAQEDQTA